MGISYPFSLLRSVVQGTDYGWDTHVNENVFRRIFILFPSSMWGIVLAVDVLCTLDTRIFLICSSSGRLAMRSW